VGKDPKRWATDLQAYNSLHFKDIYPGIDLLFHQGQGVWKYDFVVAPGGRPGDIRFSIDGIDRVQVKRGELHLEHSLGMWVEGAPVAWQEVGGQRLPVEVAWQVKNQEVVLKVGRYDRSQPLVIDPELIFASYTGSTADNWGYTATFGQGGTTYGGGTVYGPGYPLVGAFQVSHAGITDVGITKFSADGSAMIYSTYLGGAGHDQPHSLIEAANGELVVMGITGSSNFPVTPTAYDTTFNGGVLFVANQITFPIGSDLFVARFSASGAALTGSTYLGDTLNDGVNQGVTVTAVDAFRGEVTLDSLGKVWLVSTTQSGGFPTTAGAPQSTKNGFQDAVLVRMSEDLTQLEYSTFLGGEANEAGFGLAVTGQAVFVAGGTNSNTFPATPGALITTRPGKTDGFVARYSRSTGALVAATYEGTGENDVTFLLSLDPQGWPCVFGTTTGAMTASPGTLVSPGGQLFFKRYNPLLQVNDRTALLGSGTTLGLDISPTAFSIDSCGRTFFSGWGGADANAPLPTTPDALRAIKQGNELYIGVLDRLWSTLSYGTYYGSPLNEHVDGGTSRFDPSGVVHQAICAGCGGSSAFPSFPSGVVGPNNGSPNCNLAVLRMDVGAQLLQLEVTVQPDSNCVPFTPVITNASLNGQLYWWSTDGVTFSQGAPPSVPIVAPGVYTYYLVGQDTLNCGERDTLAFQIVGYDDGNGAVIQAGYDPCDTAYAIAFSNQQPADSNYFKLNATTYAGDGPHQTTLSGPGPHQLILQALLCGGWAADTLNFSFRIAPGRPAGDVVWDPCSATPTVQLQPGGTLLDTAWWDLGNGVLVSGDVSTYTYPTKGTYTVRLLTSDTVCGVSRSSAPVLVEWITATDSLVMPNVFSPNGDGQNDVFAPQDNVLVRTARSVGLKIYTRWGQEVFQGDAAGWNGTFKGGEPVKGVYFWLAQVEDACGQVTSYSGFVHSMP
jgi:gliding motility-associated-like protein